MTDVSLLWMCRVFQKTRLCSEPSNNWLEGFGHMSGRSLNLDPFYHRQYLDRYQYQLLSQTHSQLDILPCYLFMQRTLYTSQLIAPEDGKHQLSSKSNCPRRTYVEPPHSCDIASIWFRESDAAQTVHINRYVHIHIHDAHVKISLHNLTIKRPI